MRLQSLFIEEKSALTEVQEALKNGNASPLVAQLRDDVLLRFLTKYHQSQRRRWLYLVPFIVFASLQILIAFGNLFHWWKLHNFQFHLLFLPFVLIQRRKSKISPDEWTPILVRLESASLSVLLDIHRLQLPPLKEAIRTGLTKRLSVVTTDELEALTPTQRTELVRFTLAQVTPALTTSLEQSQAATVGFLALATLKLPGAEHLNPRAISQSHANLHRAIKEYQAAMESS